MIDDTNLGQCEFCGYVCDWNEIPTANDPWSDGTVTCCPECNEGESFLRYDVERAKKIDLQKQKALRNSP
jgi:hypothetical protein